MFGSNKPVATDEEWDKLCDGLNKLGKIAADRGFKLCFHHHMATVVQTFEETKRLMDNTDPRYVYLCFDTGHFTFSKEDAVKAAKEFGPRIGHVHLKDIRPDMMEKAYAEGFKFRKAVLEGCFTIPGDGCVDYPGVFKALHDAHYEGWFIVEAEQDPAKANPLEYAKWRASISEKPPESDMIHSFLSFSSVRMPRCSNTAADRTQREKKHHKQTTREAAR